MGKLANNRGASTVEIVCIVGSAVLVLALLLSFALGAFNFLFLGDDTSRISTAETLANQNIADHGCVVSDCAGDSTCTHIQGVYKTGYLNQTGDAIVATTPSVYNQSNQVLAQESSNNSDFAERNTMVVRVRYHTSGTLVCEWVLAE